MQHNYTQGMMIGLAIGFMLAPFFFVCLRLWAKWLSIKRISWDDYLTIAALLVSITCCSLQLAAAYHGHLGQHQPQNPDGSAIMDDPGLIFFEETKFALNMISILGLGLIKSSILVLYKKIFDVRKFKLVIYAMLGFVIAWTISFFFSHLFTCYPITVFLEPYYGNKCVDTIPMFMSLLFTDVVADVAILILPIPMVLGVQLPMKQKLAVIGMFSLGAAVCAISITRVVATNAIAKEYIKHPNDNIYYTAPVFFWTNIELSLAIVCACLPTLRPIWTFFCPRQPTTLRTGSGYASGYGSGYGSSKVTGTRNSSLGVKYRDFTRTPYEEIEELELTRHEQAQPGLPERGIVREVTIHQSTSDNDSDNRSYNLA